MILPTESKRLIERSVTVVMPIIIFTSDLLFEGKKRTLSLKDKKIELLFFVGEDMANKVTYAIKIKAIIALAMPLLYFLMFLPIWNGNELKIIPIDVIDIIQIASLLIAVINLYLVFVKKDVKNQTFFTVVMVISALLTCFFGVFFVEKLMGIPLFPPQD